MKRFVYRFVILAACLPFQAQASDNPSPALLAKIQIATQAYQNADSVTKEAKMVRVLKAPDGSQAPAQGTAIGGAVGSSANDGDED